MNHISLVNQCPCCQATIGAVPICSRCLTIVPTIRAYQDDNVTGLASPDYEPNMTGDLCQSIPLSEVGVSLDKRAYFYQRLSQEQSAELRHADKRQADRRQMS